MLPSIYLPREQGCLVISCPASDPLGDVLDCQQLHLRTAARIQSTVASLTGRPAPRPTPQTGPLHVARNVQSECKQSAIGVEPAVPCAQLTETSPSGGKPSVLLGIAARLQSAIAVRFLYMPRTSSAAQKCNRAAKRAPASTDRRADVQRLVSSTRIDR